MTFFEWCAVGAKIGVTAFFAVFVFALCCATVLGVLAIVARVFGGDGDEL